MTCSRHPDTLEVAGHVVLPVDEEHALNVLRVHRLLSLGQLCCGFSGKAHHLLAHVVSTTTSSVLNTMHEASEHQ